MSLFFQFKKEITLGNYNKIEWRYDIPPAIIHVYDKYLLRVQKIAINRNDCVTSGSGNGLLFRVSEGKTGIGFELSFKADNNVLTVEIPYSSIGENKPYRYLLLGIEILPGFGAQPSGSEGYLVWPNYSGLITKFNQEEPREYVDIIYSSQDRCLNFTSMPLYGVVAEGKAFLCIIESGQYECELIHRLAQGSRKLNSTTLLFRFRMDPRQKIDCVNRKASYYFYSGDDAGYVAMAKTYRKYLLEKRKQIPLAGKIKNNPVLEYYIAAQWLKIHLGEKIRQFDGRGKYRKYTSFQETQRIIKVLLGRKIDKIHCILVGWNPEGHDGRFPDKLPIDQRLGGAGELRELASWGRKNNIQIVLHDNYIEGVPFAGLFNKSDVMLDPYGFDQIISIWAGGESKRLRPDASYRNAARDLPRLKSKTGINGIYYIDAMPMNLMNDYNPRKPLNRREYAEGQVKVIKEAKKIHGGCQIECSLDFIFDAADSTASVITYPWMYFGKHEFFSKTNSEFVPFFHIAWHGIITYHHVDPGPMLSRFFEHPLDGVLHNLSWGASGRSQLSFRDIPDMPFGYIKDNRLLDFISKQYRILNKEAGFLQYEFIEDYIQNDEHSFSTLYSNGMEVKVNYKKKSYSIK